MIDFHTHLDLYPDPLAVAKECKERGIYVLSVTTTPSAWKGTSTLALAAPRIRTALGLHPQLAHMRKSELELFDTYLPETRYVGEIGLDGAPEFRKHWDDQVAVFDHVLEGCASAGGRIMSIHSRRAATAVLNRLETFPRAGIPVLHWFSGSRGEMNRAITMGCWFSVGTAMVASSKSRDLVRLMPKERILTETDGPFAQVDGHNATPWDVKRVADQLASLWNEPVDAVNDRLRNNLRQLVSSL